MSKNSTKNKQDTLIRSLEGIGDILVFETKRQKNKLVLNGLKKISDTIKKIFKMQQENPEKFEELVLSQDFLELYRTDEKEAQFRLAIDPEKYLISFSTGINQIVRVYDASISSQNVEISRFSVYHINWILAALSSRENNELFIEQILTKLAKITRTAASNNNNSVYTASIGWYTNIVFNKLENKFQLSYLELFDKYFFSTIKYLIAEDLTSIFNYLVSSLVDGIHIPFYDGSKVWDYGHLLLDSNFEKYSTLNAEYDIENKIKALDESKDELDTYVNLEAWLDKFEELKGIIEPNLIEDQNQIAQEMEEQIRDFAISKFKFQNLLELVFAIGGYCLFKKRYEYIKHFWEYKQPGDSDAEWGGNDIIPNTLDTVVLFYFDKVFFKRKFDFWEGHHGVEKYNKQYFLLLLIRILQNIRADEHGSFLQIENYKLPDMLIYRLSDMEYAIPDLVDLVGDLKQEEYLLGTVGFNIIKLDEIFDLKLIPFLNRIKEEAKKQISLKHKMGSVSENKIEEFKKDIINSFYENAVIRDIFIKYFKTFHDKINEKNLDTQICCGINVIEDKAAFFEQWHVHYSGWGKNYGRNLALFENTRLFDDLSKVCKEISEFDFENILLNFKDQSDIVIFTTSGPFWQFFIRQNNFKQKHLDDSNQIKIKNLGGWFNFNNQLIPVFKIPHSKIDNQILVLNKAKIGQLIQFAPTKQEQDNNSLEDIFYMSIKTFSENKQLMEKFVQAPPEWLQAIGEEQEQRNYLQERIQINIFECLEYKKPDDFEGYKLLLDENKA